MTPTDMGPADEDELIRASNCSLTISVVTVSYNNADTIVDTLQSVREQTHQNLQHIIIDGGSTDGTLSLIDRHGAHVAHVVSEPDDGIYHAMNKGLALCSGAFIGFLNADDMFASRDVVSLIATAGANERVDAVYGDLVYVDRHQPSKIVRYWRSGDFSPTRLRFGWMPPHPTLYVCRARLAETGGFDMQFRISADYDFALRYLNLTGLKVAYLPRILVNMRTGGVSNRSALSLLNKSREDLRALRKNKIGGLPTLFLKNARKLPQLLSKP